MMTHEQFCYWLQGLLELQPDLKTLDERQVQMLRDHLRYVFDKPESKTASVVMSRLEELSRQNTLYC